MEKQQQENLEIPPQAPQTPGISPTEFESFKNILMAVVLIMLLMVVFNLIEAWNNKGASYQNFASQINQQNLQLQKLNDNFQINKK